MPLCALPRHWFGLPTAAAVLADAAAAKKMNPVFAGYLSSGEKVGWEEVFEKERSTWWIARKAFREISLWEGKVSAPDILMEISAK
jgi:hypothetical protein